MSLPRVLHVMDALGVGGTELGLANLIERSADRIAHSVCCVRSAGATADRLAARGVPITVLHKRTGNDWGLPLRIAALCRRTQPDIVHTRNWGSIDGIVGARLAGVRVVVHGEHGRAADDPDGRNRRRNRARRVLAPLLNRVITVSDQLRRWLVDEVRLPAAKVVVLSNGVDAARFQRRADRDEIRRRAGYGPEDLVMGTVGRLDPVKNQAALIETLALLAPRYPRLRLAIAGDGPERERLAAMIVERRLTGIATLLGQRDDIPSVLNLFDVFLLPSLGEGMCNTILEAMATEVPVIATHVGGNPELVAAGTTGALVPARDTPALARAVAAYLDGDALRRQQGAAGRLRVEQEFGIDSMVERYVQLYGREMERKRCAA